MIRDVDARRRWWFCGAYTLLLAVLQLSSTAGLASIMPPIPHLDKVAHFVMYGGYAVLLLWAVASGRRPGGVRWPLVTALVLYCTGFGIAMEWAQATLAGAYRSCSGADMVANGLGAMCCGISAWMIWLRPDLRPGGSE